jgi:hypothetical protein
VPKGPIERSAGILILSQQVFSILLNPEIVPRAEVFLRNRTHITGNSGKDLFSPKNFLAVLGVLSGRKEALEKRLGTHKGNRSERSRVSVPSTLFPSALSR